MRALRPRSGLVDRREVGLRALPHRRSSDGDCPIELPVCYGNAKTKGLFPSLGRSSGINWRKLAVVAARPVLTAMYAGRRRRS